MTSERLTLALVIAAAVAPACAESRRLDWAFCPLRSFRIGTKSTQFFSCFSSTAPRSRWGGRTWGGGGPPRGGGAPPADAGDRIRQRRVARCARERSPAGDQAQIN